MTEMGRLWTLYEQMIRETVNEYKMNPKRIENDKYN
jgi:hypothetical protein